MAPQGPHCFPNTKFQVFSKVFGPKFQVLESFRLLMSCSTNLTYPDIYLSTYYVVTTSKYSKTCLQFLKVILKN